MFRSLIDFTTCCRGETASGGESVEIIRELPEDPTITVADVAPGTRTSPPVLLRRQPAKSNVEQGSAAKVSQRLVSIMVEPGADDFGLEAQASPRSTTPGSQTWSCSEREPHGDLERTPNTRRNRSVDSRKTRVRVRTTSGDSRRSGFGAIKSRVDRARSGSRESARKVKEGIVRRITRVLTRTSSVHPDDLKEATQRPVLPKTKAAASGRLPHATLPAVHRALLAEGCPVYRRFLAEALGGYDIVATNWRADKTDAEVSRMRMTYVLPPPTDIPDMAKRMVTLPSRISGRALTWFHYDEPGGRLTIKQRCRTEGVLYCDRFHIDMTVDIAVDPAGGVSFRQWVEIVWTSPLPWTQAMLGRIIEKRVVSDSNAQFQTFLAIITDVIEATESG